MFKQENETNEGNKTERRLRPEIKLALDAVEEVAKNTQNSLRPADHLFASLAATYKKFGFEDDANRWFAEAISRSQVEGTSSFHWTIVTLAQNGYEEESNNLFARWIVIAKSSAEKEIESFLNRLIFAAMLLKREDWLLSVEALLPTEQRYRDSLLPMLGNSWASLGKPWKALAIVEKIESEANRASAWGRLASTFAIKEMQEDARKALQKAEAYLNGLSTDAAEETIETIEEQIRSLVNGAIRFNTRNDASNREADRETICFEIVQAYLQLGEIEVAQNLIEKATLGDDFNEFFLRLYQERLAEELAKKRQFNEALGTAERIEPNPYLSRNSNRSRLRTLAFIGLEMAKAGKTADALSVLLEARDEANREKSDSHSSLMIAKALAESGFTDEAITNYAILYQSFLGGDKTVEWADDIANAISHQVWYGLAYEPET